MNGSLLEIQQAGNTSSVQAKLEAIYTRRKILTHYIVRNKTDRRKGGPAHTMTYTKYS